MALQEGLGQALDRKSGKTFRQNNQSQYLFYRSEEQPG